MSKNLNYTHLLTPSIRPQDDFFGHVNHKWLSTHPIPESEVRWGTFNILRDEAWRAMRNIYELLDADHPSGNADQQAYDFYSSGMNYDRHEASHLDLLYSYFTEIDSIKDTEDLSRFIGKMNQLQIGAPWYVWVDTDHDDSTSHILHIYQSGLTLPNRNYYLDDTKAMKAARAKYKEYMQTIAKELPRFGVSVEEMWNAIMSFETELAKASRSAADLRDVEKNFNKTSFDSLTSNYAAISWPAYAAALGWDSRRNITVDQPEFLAFVNKALEKTSLDSWKLYLKWRITNRCLPYISEKYSQIHFSFFGKVLSGATEMMPLWKRVVLALDSGIGEASGRLYAKHHFPEKSKRRVLELVEDVRTAYSERIAQLDWMSGKTKKYALKKLKNMKVLIGYPDTWRDFSGLAITKNSYLANILEAHKFDMAYWLSRLDEPTSREDWLMNPQTVNAYHDPSRLVICFPAAILQAPFFSPDAPLAANMAGIGTVIGHEFTHGFDDQGCQFDAEGNVRQWQTAKERQIFAKLAQGIVNQADNFLVLPDLNLKGKLVLGESIADLGGVEIAFHALKAKIKSLDDPLTDGLSARQLFFINYAFTECENVRPEKLREYTLNDPHPASIFRVNGILQHVDDFYTVFDIRPKDKLYQPPRSRVKIW